MARIRSTRESYLGCARGYLRLGRPEEARAELSECLKHYGGFGEAFELMIEAISELEDWQGLIDFGYSLLSKHGKVHDYGWACVIRGLLHSGKGHLALRAARSARANCGERNMIVALESLRVLAMTERYHAARNLYLEILVADPMSAAIVAEDADFADFLRIYVSGNLSTLESDDDPWGNDGSEVR